MGLGILALVVAVLEAYAWLFRPDAFSSISPITIGLPILLAAAVFKRPANERASILTFAAMLGILLNRAVIPSRALVHAAVFGGAAFLAWRGWVATEPRSTARRGFAVAAWAWRWM